MLIQDIQLSVKMNLVIVSRHGREEAEADNLKLDEILSSVMQGEIIEDYPDDQPLPSCLIYGESQNHKPVHSVWGYNKDTGYAVLITVYRPDPAKWINGRTRRKLN
jgi:hypothetical protein